jgi:pimeloyl-ACP methyl ester carboxylesterase
MSHHPPTTQFLVRNEVRLAYQVYLGTPAVPPLVMIMGLAGVKEDWRQLAPGLAVNRPVLVMDNRGIGESDVPPGPYTISMFVDDVLAAMDELGWKQADVFGISMGGMIAQQLVLAQPERVRRLILGCTMHGGPRQVPPRPEVLQALLPQRNVDPQFALRKAMMVNYTPQWVESHPEFFDALLRENTRYKRSSRGIMAQMQAIMKFDVENLLSQIGCPTLVIHGDEDQLLPLPNGQAIAAKIPGSIFHLLHHCGHVFWHMDEGESQRVIELFLDESRSSST